MARCRLVSLLGLMALSACNAGGAAGVPGDAEDAQPFAQIGPDERVQFTGTEPFWGGSVTGSALTYSTPEVPDGTVIEVTRFAGRGGLSWTGILGGQRFALAITPGECSDGMSDRTYPLVATLAVEGQQRSGCGWTEKQPFQGPE